MIVHRGAASVACQIALVAIACSGADDAPADPIEPPGTGPEPARLEPEPPCPEDRFPAGMCAISGMPFCIDRPDETPTSPPQGPYEDCPRGWEITPPPNAGDEGNPELRDRATCERRRAHPAACCYQRFFCPI